MSTGGTTNSACPNFCISSPSQVTPLPSRTRSSSKIIESGEEIPDSPEITALKRSFKLDQFACSVLSRKSYIEVVATEYAKTILLPYSNNPNPTEREIKRAATWLLDNKWQRKRICCIVSYICTMSHAADQKQKKESSGSSVSGSLELKAKIIESLSSAPELFREIHDKIKQLEPNNTVTSTEKDNTIARANTEKVIVDSATSANLGSDRKRADSNIETRRTLATPVTLNVRRSPPSSRPPSPAPSSDSPQNTLTHVQSATPILSPINQYLDTRARSRTTGTLTQDQQVTLRVKDTPKFVQQSSEVDKFANTIFWEWDRYKRSQVFFLCRPFYNCCRNNTRLQNTQLKDRRASLLTMFRDAPATPSAELESVIPVKVPPLPPSALALKTSPVTVEITTHATPLVTTVTQPSPHAASVTDTQPSPSSTPNSSNTPRSAFQPVSKKEEGTPPSRVLISSNHLTSIGEGALSSATSATKRPSLSVHKPLPSQ